MGQSGAHDVATPTAPTVPVVDRAAFIKELERSGLLSETQMWRWAYGSQAKDEDGAGLARRLLLADVLTPYQVNQLLAGRGRELLLGPYRLLERLGQGGMGQVFKAHDVKLNRVVAVKVLHKQHGQDQHALARFQREIEAVARLTHPNIIRAYDADEANGHRFLVMEYVEGFDLSRLVKEVGPMPVDLACHCIYHAALGLHHAHENGLIHRDLKPSNLLLRARWEAMASDPSKRTLRYKQLKLLDLGLARFLEKAQPNTAPGQNLTQMDQIMGTPDYMAPEQARDSHRVSPQSDVYALGATFYYCLMGHPPFPNGTALEKLMQHQLEEPKPIETIRTDVPPRIIGLINAMMAKQPAQRPASGRDVAIELKNWRRSSMDSVVVPEGKPNAVTTPEVETPQENSSASATLQFPAEDVSLRALHRAHVASDKTLWVILSFGVIFVSIVVLIVTLLLR